MFTIVWVSLGEFVFWKCLPADTAARTCNTTSVPASRRHFWPTYRPVHSIITCGIAEFLKSQLYRYSIWQTESGKLWLSVGNYNRDAYWYVALGNCIQRIQRIREWSKEGCVLMSQTLWTKKSHHFEKFSKTHITILSDDGALFERNGYTCDSADATEIRRISHERSRREREGVCVFRWHSRNNCLKNLGNSPYVQYD